MWRVHNVYGSTTHSTQWRKLSCYFGAPWISMQSSSTKCPWPCSCLLPIRQKSLYRIFHLVCRAVFLAWVDDTRPYSIMSEPASGPGAGRRSKAIRSKSRQISQSIEAVLTRSAAHRQWQSWLPKQPASGVVYDHDLLPETHYFTK